MKNFKLYSFIALGVTLASMILPYKSFDKYTGGFFSASRLVESNIHEAGLELPQSYVLLAALLVIALVTLIKENLTTSIIGFILGVFALLYMPLFAFSLVFSLNFGGGPRNQEIEIGFFIAAIAVLSYAIILLMNLIKHAKARKNNRELQTTKANYKESNLLDDLLND